MADKKDESNPDLDTLAEGWEPSWEQDGKSDEADLKAVDDGWLDELFPEEEEPDEPEEEEPPLPDERLDPEAYAAAKKAREERAEVESKRGAHPSRASR